MNANSMLDSTEIDSNASAETSTPSSAAPRNTRLAASSQLSVREALCLTVWTALFLGLLDAAHWKILNWQTGLLFRSTNVYWLAAVAQLLIFSVPTLAFVAIGAVHRSWLRFWPIATMLLFWSAYELLLMFFSGKIHGRSLLLLSFGIAVQGGRIACCYQDQLLRVVRRTLIPMAVGVGVIWLCTEVRNSLERRQALAKVPPAQPGAPNVLVIVLDTFRADLMQAYGGDPSITPNLNRIASRGALFQYAYSTAPWTLPAHASMFTGKLPHELSAGWRAPLDGKHPTLAEELARHGYESVGLVANLSYCCEETGLDRGFHHYEDFPFTLTMLLNCTRIGRSIVQDDDLKHWFRLARRRDAEDVTRRFLNWEAHRSGRPFFAFLNFFDTHHPYLLKDESEGSQEMTPEETKILANWWHVKKSTVTADQLSMAKRSYLQCASYVDDKLGEMLDTLEARGLLDNTLLIITADHGEQFNEHGIYGHGNSLYDGVIRVPLLVSWPGHVPENVTIQQPVSIRSLSATVVDLLNVKSVLRGDSWRDLWEPGSQAAAERPEPIVMEIDSPPKHPPSDGESPIMRGAMRAVVVGHAKYILNGDGVEELYDIASDRDESRNLIADENFQDDLSACREAFREAYE